MTQPIVPFWLAAIVVVLSAMCATALTVSDPALTFLTPTVRFVLLIVNVGLTTLAAVLNIKRPSSD